MGQRVYLPLAMLGFAGWNTSTGVRAGLTASAFVILFAFIGQPFNQYWGSMIAPLLTLGVAQAPLAIGDLIHRSRGISSPPSTVLAPELLAISTVTLFMRYGCQFIEAFLTVNTFALPCLQRLSHRRATC